MNDQTIKSTAYSIVNECCGQTMTVADLDLLEDRIVDAMRHAHGEGRDEVLKLAAKIVSKLEVAMKPDFATQIEEALRSVEA